MNNPDSAPEDEENTEGEPHQEADSVAPQGGQPSLPPATPAAPQPSSEEEKSRLEAVEKKRNKTLEYVLNIGLKNASGLHKKRTWWIILRPVHEELVKRQKDRVAYNKAMGIVFREFLQTMLPWAMRQASYPNMDVREVEHRYNGWINMRRQHSVEAAKALSSYKILEETRNAAIAEIATRLQRGQEAHRRMATWVHSADHTGWENEEIARACIATQAWAVIADINAEKTTGVDPTNLYEQHEHQDAVTHPKHEVLSPLSLLPEDELTTDDKKQLRMDLAKHHQAILQNLLKTLTLKVARLSINENLVHFIKDFNVHVHEKTGDMRLEIPNNAYAQNLIQQKVDIGNTKLESGPIEDPLAMMKLIEDVHVQIDAYQRQEHVIVRRRSQRRWQEPGPYDPCLDPDKMAPHLTDRAYELYRHFKTQPESQADELNSMPATPRPADNVSLAEWEARNEARRRQFYTQAFNLIVSGKVQPPSGLGLYEYEDPQEQEEWLKSEIIEIRNKTTNTIVVRMAFIRDKVHKISAIGQIILQYRAREVEQDHLSHLQRALREEEPQSPRYITAGINMEDGTPQSPLVGEKEVVDYIQETIKLLGECIQEGIPGAIQTAEMIAGSLGPDLAEVDVEQCRQKGKLYKLVPRIREHIHFVCTQFIDEVKKLMEKQ